jgi:hypothetical protein
MRRLQGRKVALFPSTTLRFNAPASPTLLLPFVLFHHPSISSRLLRDYQRESERIHLVASLLRLAPLRSQLVVLSQIQSTSYLVDVLHPNGFHLMLEVNPGTGSLSVRHRLDPQGGDVGVKLNETLPNALEESFSSFFEVKTCIRLGAFISVLD